MTTADDVRALALALPEATEGTHFRLTAFRVRGRSFASLEPDGTHAMLRLDPPQVRAVVAEGAEEVRRGDQILGVRVALADVPAGRLARLVELAWRGRAPRTLVARLDAERGSADGPAAAPAAQATGARSARSAGSGSPSAPA